MIHAVDRALERHLRRAVPLPEAAVDVAFEAPDRTWGAALTRPTVNVFLWQVLRNTGLQYTGVDQRVRDDGNLERRRALPVVDLNYLVTAWASDLRDEHQLLGSVLECVLAGDVLPADVLPDRLAGTRCRIGLSPRDKAVPHEFWSSLDGRLKPGLQVTVTLPLEVFAWQPTAAPAEEIGVGLTGIAPPAPVPAGAAAGLRRRRRPGGAMVMEGRAGDTTASDDVSGNGHVGS